MSHAANSTSTGREREPEPPRTISVREAARLQSFPDRFRFLGAFTRPVLSGGQCCPTAAGESCGRSHPAGRADGNDATEGSTTMKPIRLSGHARDQLGYRGVGEQGVIEAMRTAPWGPAELGRLECRKDFPFGCEWNGRFYATKQVRPIFADQPGKSSW